MMDMICPENDDDANSFNPFQKSQQTDQEITSNSL